MDVSSMHAPKSALSSAQFKRSINKSDEVSDTVRYDQSLVDKMYYEGVVAEFHPDREKHKEQKFEEVGKDNDVKESENQNENDNHVKKSENEAELPTETGKDKETFQEFSPKAVESKHVATANVSSPCQRNSVLDESSFRSNEKKPVPQGVETTPPSKSQSPPDETRVKETDVCPKSAIKSASREGNLTETPVTSAKRKHSTSKDKVYDTIRYDESLVGTKVKVWWPEDNMYYKGVVAKFYPDKKKHKVSYVDGDEETLNLRTQHWKILKESSLRDDKVQNVEVQSEEGSLDIHKTKKSKTDPAVSQEKIKCSANKVGDVSSFGKSNGSTPKDNLSTQKNSGKSCDAATTASKEAVKSKEDEETLKINTKTKTVNKSNGKTPPSSSKFNVKGPTKAEKTEYDKERLRLEAEKLKIKADKGQSKIRLQDERLRLKAEKMKLLKKESDIRIMMIDARVMPEMQRLYFEELQREIIMRRSHT